MVSALSAMERLTAVITLATEQSSTQQARQPGEVRALTQWKRGLRRLRGAFGRLDGEWQRWEPVFMSIAGQSVIEAFDHLPTPERVEVLRVLLSRAAEDAVPADDELVAAAAEIFLSAGPTRESGVKSPSGRSLVG